MAKAGVFCMETGDWWGRLRDHNSVEPCLELLSQPGLLPIPAVYRTVMTHTEFAKYLAEWVRPKNAQLNVLYLAFHGQTNGLDFGWTSRRTPDVSLGELGEMLSRKCEGRVIHLGTCLGLKDPVEVSRFVKTTRCLAFSGYARTVGWMKSAVLDMLYLHALANHGVTRRGLGETRKELEKDMGGLVKTYGFQIHVSHSR